MALGKGFFVVFLAILVVLVAFCLEGSQALSKLNNTKAAEVRPNHRRHANRLQPLPPERLDSASAKMASGAERRRAAQKLQSENTVIDLGIGYTNLMYAWASYCAASSLESWTCSWCQNTAILQQFQIDSTFSDYSTNTFGYIGHNDYEETVNVVFRGTVMSSLENWITDLSFAHTQLYSNVPGAEVHEGFYDAYLAVATQINNVVEELTDRYPSYSLVVTGHSLGGALATLCALNFTETHSANNLYVYTFGSPRVGNTVFAEFYDSHVPNTWRMTNHDDIVPHLPPVDLNFFHVCTENWYNGYEWVGCDPSYGEDPNCADSVSVVDYSVSDHLDYFGVEESC